MIVTERKPFEEILKRLGGAKCVFLVGCGECSTTCKSGGEEELARLKEELKASGISVSASIIPKAPCIASQTVLALAKSRKELEASDAVLVLACGLGVQSVKENLRKKLTVHAGCDTLFISTLDKSGCLFFEKCSACGQCILDETATICPVTRCAKGLLNGPCGGMFKGKCEVDRDKDCAWVLIYNQLKEENRLGDFSKIQNPKDYSKQTKPRTKSLK